MLVVLGIIDVGWSVCLCLVVVDFVVVKSFCWRKIGIRKSVVCSGGIGYWFLVRCIVCDY